MYGRDKIAPAEKRIDAWLDLRLRTGFSEWLSNVYYDEDITALVNLIDFSDNSELTGKAQEVLNSIFLDMALNSFYGIFGSTHGRSYTEEKQNPLTESTIDTEKLLFGMGIYAGEEVNIYMYKCRDYSLSCAQDYRKGYGGDQQHIWQATLSPKALKTLWLLLFQPK